MRQEIPVFFTADDRYVPYLDVAIRSLIANASKSYAYRIIVLNTGIKEDNAAKVRQNERDGVRIDFVDISHRINHIKARFKNVYHYSVVTYYRLFIASLFPQYDKIIYLDCDVIVRGDIAELYETDLGDNILGAVPDQYVPVTEPFKAYVERAVGVPHETYFNAGVLLFSLEQFRKHKIEEKFISLITEHDFDLVDPDQAYLNYLCFEKTLILPNGWNKAPSPAPCEGKKNIVHYALYKKPWQYDDVTDGDYFWDYAKNSPFYALIQARKANFSEEEKQANAAMAQEILFHASKITASNNTFATKLKKEG